MTTLGRIAAIHRYPVKSMHGESLERADVGERGLAGDRAFAVFDPAERRAGSAKHTRTFPRILDCEARYVGEPGPDGCVEMALPDGRRVRSDDAALAEALSACFGHEVALGRLSDGDDVRPVPGRYAMPGTFFDYAPLHLVTNRALAAMQAAAPGSRFDARRFRPNLVIAMPSGPAFPENEWVGRRLRIGDSLVVRVTDPCPRCVLPTFVHGPLPYDPEVLKAIARQNTAYAPVLESDQPCLGAYAFVEAAGGVRVGDEVVLEGV